MEQQDANTTSGQCRAGCGFYGSPATDGMCSKCYKDELKRKMQMPQSSPSPAIQINSNADASNLSFSSSSSSSNLASMPAMSSSVPIPTGAQLIRPASTVSLSSAASTASDSALSSSPVLSSSLSSSLGPQSPMSSSSSPSKKNKCEVCKGKIPLAQAFPCRCGGLFCPAHRYHTEHPCSYDWKKDGMEQIKKNNPVVRGEKVQKI